MSTDMDGCLVFGREQVKFLSLSLVCGGALCVFIPGVAKGTQLGDGCSLGKYEGEGSMMASIRSQLVLGTGCSQDGRKV